MHDQYVCTNVCCKRYHKDYHDAMQWLDEQNIEAERLLATSDGDRVCNYCESIQSWDTYKRPTCGTRIGMLEPDKPKPVEVAAPPIPDSALFVSNLASLMSDFAAASFAISNENSVQDSIQSLQCEICEWHNPPDLFQCERCTANLPRDAH